MCPFSAVFLITLLSSCNGFLEVGENGALSPADIKTLKTQLETEQARRIINENNLNTVMAKMEKLAQEVQSLQQTCSSASCTGTVSVTKSYPPQAFKAKLSHGSKLGTDQVIVYDQVVIDEGHGYNPATGIFTANVNGTYTFSINVCTFQNHWLAIEIMKNGVQIGQASTGDANYNNCGAEVTVAHLVQGDRVWVQHEANRGSQLLRLGSIWNSFAGILSEAD